MKPSQHFSHRPPSKTTLLHDTVPGIPVYHKTRVGPREFWLRFLPLRMKTQALAKKNVWGLSS